MGNVAGRFLLASIIAGVVTGIFVVIYGLATKLLTTILFFGDPIKTIPNLPWWYLYLVPTVAILIVNYLISKHQNIKEYGVNEIAIAVEENSLNFSFKDLIIKIFASSISLASGFAVGNEGPSAAIGAILSERIHKFFQLPKELLRVSLSIGASSGIAAIFVSPITGIVFAIENIAYDFVKNYIGYLIIGSLISFSFAWEFLEPLVFEYSTGKNLNYDYMFSLVMFIPIITFFIYFYLGLKDRVLKFLNSKLYDRFPKYKNIIFAIVAGGIIGTLMMISPYAVFSGHEVVSTLINDKLHLSFWVIFAIIVLRIIATSVSLYSNAIGGIFISLMSIGALVGYGFGELMIHFHFHIEAFYFAAIGSAVFMGVNMKLPLTAIVVALETTYDYNVVVPVGISVVIVSYLTSLEFNIKKRKLKG